MRTKFRFCGQITLDTNIVVGLFGRESPVGYVFFRLLYLTKNNQLFQYGKCKKEDFDLVFIVCVYGVNDG